jgi:hypothetical protein
MRRTGPTPITRRPVIVRPTFTFLAAFALAAASTIGTAAAHNPPRAGASDARPLADPGLDPAAAPRTITLVTGDHFAVASGAAGSSISRLDGPSRAFESYRSASGDRYMVPVEALPYLGRGLDPSLFDIDSLLRVPDAATRVPLAMALAPGAAVPAGITLSRAARGTASGYATAASGAAFATALKARIGADIVAGRRAGSTRPFDGLASISLAAPARTAPAFAPTDAPTRTLTIDATDLAGAPTDNISGLLMNTDSLATWNDSVTTVNGVARLQVPAGHYAAQFGFVDYDASGEAAAIRLVTLADFTVPASRQSTTIAVDERAARVPITFTTPRPATETNTTVTVNRWDAAGALGGGLVAADYGQGPAYFSNAQPPARIGRQRYVATWSGIGPATGSQYRYDLAYGSDDVPAHQTHRPAAADLAAVHEVFYADPALSVPASPFRANFASAAYDAPGGTFILPFAPPLYTGQVTDYLGTGDGGAWMQAYITPNGLYDFSDVNTYQPDRAYRVEWAHGPLAPNAGQHAGPTGEPSCVACVSGTEMYLEFSRLGDSEPDHSGATAASSGGTSTHYAVYENGKALIDQDNARSALLTAVPAAPTTYREVFDTYATGIGSPSQSTTTHTDLTFVYRPQAHAETLPADDWCAPGRAIHAPCRILPVLSLGYDLATDRSNTSHQALQTLSLSVGHLSYDGRGSHTPITSVSVSVSFDRGATWHPASIRATTLPGRYAVTWPNPPASIGTSPDLRVTATDAADGSISQTIDDAYTIGQP